MSFVSHAQNFEDVVLWRALRHVAGGTYLDIGAQDPVVDSVSRSFYDAGWRGVHVEPVPHYAAALRADRPDERVIAAVVGDEAGLSKFHEIPDTGLSTGLDAFADRARESGWTDRIIPVPRVRLDALFDLFDGRDIHWMKIDVEGMEPDVLRGWGDHPARPWIVVVESVAPLSQVPSHEAWIGELTDRGYREIYFDGLNRFFVGGDHPELSPSFAAPPNVFDDIVLPPIHWAARLALQRGEDALVAATAGWDERNAAAERDLAAAYEQVRLNESAARECEQARHQADERLQQALADVIGLQSGHERAVAALTSDHLARHARADEDLRAAQAALLGAKDALADALSSRASHSEEAAEAQRVQVEALHAQTARRHERLETRLLSAQAQLVAAKDAVAQLGTDARARADLADATHRAHVASLEARIATLSAELDVARARHVQPALPDAGSVATGNPLMSEPAFVTVQMVAPAANLRELLELHDRAFVQSAYLTLLGRDADPEGEAHHLTWLRKGVAKLHILRQMRRSREGRAHDPGIAGLDRAIRRHRRSSLPLVGPLFRLIEGGEGDGRYVRRFRALANDAGRLRDDQAMWMTQLIQMVDQRILAPPAPPAPEPAAEATAEPETHDVSRLAPRALEIYRRLTSAR